MSIASLFVQPQRIGRAKPVSGKISSLVTDLLRLCLRLVSSPEHLEPVSQILVSAVEKSVSVVLLAKIEENRQAVQTRLDGFLKPLADHFRDMGARAGSGDADEIERLAQEAFKGLTAFIQALSLDEIRELCRQLSGLLEEDLGLTPDFLQRLLDDLFSCMAEDLKQAAETQEDRALRQNMQELSRLIQRFNRVLRTDLSFPGLDAEKAARDIYGLIQRSGAASAAQKINCALENISTLSELAQGINTTVKGAASLAGDGPGAAACNFSSEREHLWYASWLLKTEYRDIPLFEPEDIKDESLVQGLRSQEDEQARFLRGRLFQHERELVDQYSSGEMSYELKTAVAAMLNRVIQSEDLSSCPAFRSTPKEEDTTELISNRKYVEDRELALLNRRIIEDRYPRLERLPRSWWKRFLYWVWETVCKCKEPVWLDQGAGIIYLGDRILYSSDNNVDWKEAPVFGHGNLPQGLRYYSMETVPGDFLEKYTWYSSWILKGLKATGHLIPWISGDVPGHYVPSLMNSIYDFLTGTLQVIVKRPLYGFNCLPIHLVDLLMRPFLVTMSSLQHRHTKTSTKNSFLFWITVFMGDVVRTISPNLYLATLPETLRDVSLSFMTQLNQSGEWKNWAIHDGDSLNFEKSWETDSLVFMLFTILTASLVDIDEYTHPFKPEDVPNKVWLKWFGAGTGFGLLSGVLASLVTAFTAGAWSNSHFLWNLLKGPGYVLGLFWPMLYSLREGDTDEGRFNPLGGDRFQGYPDKSSAPSPYLLPFEKGKSIFVGQANSGIFSHNPCANGIGTENAVTAQTYAYDFSMDQDEEILASRPGTVVEFFEDFPNDKSWDDLTDAEQKEMKGHRWNYIIIRHDLTEDQHGNLSPAPPDPVHDKRENGRTTVTYAVYGHGRTGSITQAFGGTAPEPNVTRVRRGQPIMLAGDTGNSFHNHLHMHVLPESGGTVDKTITIPFVFQDVEDNGGVCQHLHYYQSSNEKIT